MLALTVLVGRPMRAAWIAPIVLQFFCGAVFCQEVVTNEPLEKSKVIATCSCFL